MRKRPPRPERDAVLQAPQPTPAPPAAATETPRTPADIPGIGPIRLRALQKAGMTSLRDLKAATVAELTAVRGITEIKAQQIHDYLAQFAELHDPPVALPTLVLVETAPLERALLLIGTAVPAVP